MVSIGYRLFSVAAAGVVAAAVVSADVIINDSVAYWNFESSEAPLENLVVSGEHYDATMVFGSAVTGVVEGESGIAGSAMLFDGASCMRLPYGEAELGTSFTVSLWYWQESDDVRQTIFQSVDNYTISYEMWTDMVSIGSHLGHHHIGGVGIALQEWTHVAFTVASDGNTTTGTVYSNGVAKVIKNINAIEMAENYRLVGLHVGAFRDAARVSVANSRCFKGMIDEIALWDRTLSAAEVEAVYQRGVSGEGLDVVGREPGYITPTDNQLVYTLSADDLFEEGAYYKCWLPERVTHPAYPYVAVDSANAALRVVGSTMPDEGGHEDGPFDAEMLGENRWRIPLVANSALAELPLGDFTLEGWFKSESLDPGVLFGSYIGNTTPAGVVNLQHNSNGELLFYIRNHSHTVDRIQLKPPAHMSFLDDEWHHLAGMVADGKAYLYLDGVLVGSNVVMQTSGFTLGGDYYYMGQDGRNYYGQFNGELGTLRAWQRALSEAELEAIQIGEIPGGDSISSSDLVAEYHLYKPNHARRIAFPNESRRNIEITPQLRTLTCSEFTIEVEFRTTDNGRGVLLGNYDGNQERVLNFELFTGNKLRIFLAGYDSIAFDMTRSEGVGVRDGEWHRAVVVKSADSVTLYMDGVQLGAAQAIAPEYSYPLRKDQLQVGGDFRDSAIPLKGDIGGARFWRRALSSEEVEELTLNNVVPQDKLQHEYLELTYTESLRSAGFEGEKFLRSFGRGENKIELFFRDLPRHDKVSISGLLAALDSLEPITDNDYFAISIDGVEVLNVGLASGQNSSVEPRVSWLKLFGVSADVEIMNSAMVMGERHLFTPRASEWDAHDSVYDLALIPELQDIRHSSSTMLVEVMGRHNGGPNDESFGLSNFTLTLQPPRGTIIVIQ